MAGTRRADEVTSPAGRRWSTSAASEHTLDDRVPFLARLEHENRTALLALGRPVRFASRSLVIRQDDPSSHVVLILNGWTKVTATALNGYEALLALRGPGDIVGESAVFHGRSRSATVTSLEEIEAVSVEQSRFACFLQHTPEAALQLVGLVTDRMRSSDRRRLQFASLTVRERFAVLLLELARTHGHHTEDGLCLTVRLSQQELAGSVGASREAVARLLKGLRDRGAVTTSRRSLVIVRPELLRQIARGG